MLGSRARLCLVESWSSPVFALIPLARNQGFFFRESLSFPCLLVARPAPHGLCSTCPPVGAFLALVKFNLYPSRIKVKYFFLFSAFFSKNFDWLSKIPSTKTPSRILFRRRKSGVCREAATFKRLYLKKRIYGRHLMAFSSHT